MRIVAGRWRGRTIRPPSDERVRPTADRVREAWMSIVQPWLPESRVLDLFAGSGALGLEALSRGAASADLVEISASSLRAMRENAEALGATQARIHRGDAIRFAESLDAGAYDVAFADPPYRMGLAVRVAEIWLATPFAEVFGVEHEARESMPGEGVTRRYGDTAITFYQREDHAG
jgi:16S rRNA (guanine966-N2)-methyltransferase